VYAGGQNTLLIGFDAHSAERGAGPGLWSYRDHNVSQILR
jgi:hypothetical protein